MAQLGKSAHSEWGGMALSSLPNPSYNGCMYVGRSPLFTVNKDCLAVADRVVVEVEAAGMETRRTFDLDAVRSGNPQFLCPIHGSGNCTCQFVILLVMLRCGHSLTVILEGRDQQTWIYLDSGQGEAEEQVDPVFTGALYHALFPKSPFNL